MSKRLQEIGDSTLGYYNDSADEFWAGTKDHDVSQNMTALLNSIEGCGPHRILDFGCGPGRDIRAFKNLGHDPVGLDGSAKFCAMARAHSGCDVWHQNFLALDLPDQAFDGVFANASLFHVPTSELPSVLRALCDTLVPGGIFFSSNPRGGDTEGWNGPRFGAYHTLTAWRGYMTTAGFIELSHYYRPAGLPREQQHWLASVWAKSGDV